MFWCGGWCGQPTCLSSSSTMITIINTTTTAIAIAIAIVIISISPRPNAYTYVHNWLEADIRFPMPIPVRDLLSPSSIGLHLMRDIGLQLWRLWLQDIMRSCHNSGAKENICTVILTVVTILDTICRPHLPPTICHMGAYIYIMIGVFSILRVYLRTYSVEYLEACLDCTLEFQANIC